MFHYDRCSSDVAIQCGRFATFPWKLQRPVWQNQGKAMDGQGTTLVATGVGLPWPVRKSCGLWPVEIGLAKEILGSALEADGRSPFGLLLINSSAIRFEKPAR